MSLSDPDGVPDTATSTWHWERSEDGSTGWTTATTTTESPISPNSVSESTYTPVEDDIGHFLRVTVSYTDSQGPDKSTDPFITANKVVRNLVNDPPYFVYAADDDIPEGSALGDKIPDDTGVTREVAENSAANTAVGGPIMADDEDIDNNGNKDVLTYEFNTGSSTGVDHGSFTIDRNTGQIRVKAGTELNRETKASYVVTVVARDPSYNPDVTPLSQDSIDVTINLTDMPEDPSIEGAANITLTEITDSVRETNITLGGIADSRNPVLTADGNIILATFTATDDEDDQDDQNQRVDGAIKWSLSGSDSDRFDIGDTTTSIFGVENVVSVNDMTSTVVLRLKELPDYEDPANSNNAYRVTITATDSTGLTATQAVLVQVRNIDEPGSVDLYHRQPQARSAITASLEDPDNTQGTISYTWATSTASTLPGTWGVIPRASRSSYTPPAFATTTDPYFLRVVANYTDGEGSGKTATTVPAFQVRARPDSNTAPSFPNTTVTTLSIDEITNSGVDIGSPISADDTEDRNRLEYRLDTTSQRFFDIERDTGQLMTKASLNHETRDSYNVTVYAEDPSLEEGRIQVTVNVNDVNEPHVVTADGTRIDTTHSVSVDERTAITTPAVTYIATDPDDGEEFTWTKAGDGAGAFDFYCETSARVFSRCGPGESISGRRVQLRFVSLPVHLTEDSYEVTIAVEDGRLPNNNLNWTLTVNVADVDEAGAVSLSTLQPLEKVPFTATLTDPDGLVTTATTTWHWERSESGTSGWTTATTTSEGPSDNDNVISYTPVADDINHFLRVTATYTDEQGSNKMTDPERTANKVARNLVNDPPYFIYTEDDDNLPEGMKVGDKIGDGVGVTREIAENSPANTVIGLPIRAYDEDIDNNNNKDVLTWEFDTGQGTDHTLFDIDRGTGQIRVGANPTLNRESTNQSYTVTIIVKDPSDTTGTPFRDMITVTINVTNVDEGPSLEGATTITLTEIIDATSRAATTTEDGGDGTAATFPNNNVKMGTFMASDDEDDSNISPAQRDVTSLKWTLSGPDMDRFVLCDENENTPANCGTENIASDDASTSTVELRLKEYPNYEDPANSNNRYRVTLTVKDSTTPTPLTATHDVTIQVINVDEMGSVELSNLQPEIDAQITAKLTDPDGRASGITWQWSYDESGARPIVNATSESYTPAPGDSGETLYATASYTDPQGGDKEATGDSGTRMVQAHDFANIPPAFPDIDPSPNVNRNQVRYVLEDSVGVDVVVTANGIDEDPVAVDPDDLLKAADSESATSSTSGGTLNDRDDILTYTLRGTDSENFSVESVRSTPFDRVDSSTLGGRISVVAGKALDYEEETSYTITVRATDPSGAYDEITLTINVVNKDEAPSVEQVEQLRLTCDKTEESFEENQTGTVATCTASVPDGGGTVTWSRIGPDSSVFSISSNGVLSIDSQLDYEPHSDADGDNVYEVTVTAEAGGVTRSQDIEVTLVNVEEPGTVSISPAQPPYRVGDVLSASLDEGDEETVTGWQWARSTTAGGTFTPIGGATSDTYRIDVADVDNFLQVTVTYDQPAPLPSGQQLSEETATAVALASTEPETDGTVSFDPAQPIVDTELTASVSDSDGGRSAITWEWARDSSSTGSFTDVIAETSDSYTPVEADAGMYLRATAMYTDDDGDNIARGTTSIVAIHSYDNVIVDGRINGEEVLNAVRDYFDDVITGQEVLAVVRLYFKNF